MKKVYCANCGKALSVYRRALPKYAIIVDVVDYHECSEEVEELDIELKEVKFQPKEGKDKFVQKLNELAKSLPEGSSDLEPKLTQPNDSLKILENIKKQLKGE